MSPCGVITLAGKTAECSLSPAQEHTDPVLRLPDLPPRHPGSAWAPEGPGRIFLPFKEEIVEPRTQQIVPRNAQQLARRGIADAPADGRGEPCPNCGQIHPDNSQAAEQPVSAGLKIGEPAPPVRLRDLKDKKVKLASFRGQKALVLFWNPGCGFCQQMLPELKEWEQNPPDGAPKLLVVSSGTKEANREMAKALQWP